MGNPATVLQLKNFKAAMRLPNMKAFGLFPASQDLSWIASASGAIYAPNTNLISTGVYSMIDPGSGALVSPSGGADVYLNGVHLTPGLGYAIAGAYITFLSGYVPTPGVDNIRIQFENGPFIATTGSAALNYVNLIGVKDGSNIHFSIPLGSVSFAAFFRNGQLQAAGVDYNISGISITILTYPPNSTDTLGALYLP